MSKKKKSNKHTKNHIEAFTEEQYEEYLKELYGMEFIAGFTEGGVPYGLFNEVIPYKGFFGGYWIYFLTSFSGFEPSTNILLESLEALFLFNIHIAAEEVPNSHNK